MNSIFGLLNLDQSPVDSSQLAAMGAGMDWRQEGNETWLAGEVGLGCVQSASATRGGGAHRPLHQPDSRLTLAAGARLDNRPALLHKLSHLLQRPPGTHTDDEIILSAYSHWGEDCVHHLEGDWHFAIWDEPAHNLFLARDHHGNTGLYYYQGPQFFAFASIKKGLLALESIPQEPDLLRIAQVLTSWPGDGVRTGYRNILRLPPAHRMTISANGLKTERYWSPEPRSELHLKSDDAYVEAFLEVFTQAVDVRLRGQRQVGVTLSGGLDSGAVASVAARLLRDRGERLLAFTSAPLSHTGQYTEQGRFGDETQLASTTAKMAGNMDHRLIRAEKVSPLDGIERMLAVHDEPGHAAGNQYWLAALLEAARQQDAGVLLTGQLGNATISWPGGGENLLPLLLHGETLGFWRGFEKARRSTGLSRWRTFRRFLLKPLVMPLWLQYQQRWRFGPPTWHDYSAINLDFARRINLNQQMATAGHLPPIGSTDPLQQRMLIIQPGKNILGASWMEKGIAYGLDVRDPTQDRQVMELCLAIPESQYQRNGEDRWLIRRAMRGYLPDAVRLNTRRGLQAADLGQRVLASRDEVGDILIQFQKHPLAREILDLPRMAGVLESLSRGITSRNTVDCGTILLRGLMAGLFLLRF